MDARLAIMTQATGHFLHNLLYFGRLLRALGLDVQPDGVSNTVKATRWVPIESRRDFYHTTRALFVRRQQDLAAFDQAFEEFWRAVSKTEGDPSLTRTKDVRIDTALAEPPGVEGKFQGVGMRYSPQELLREVDFSAMDRDELELVKPMLANLAWKLGRRSTRRWQMAGSEDIDIRHTLKASLRSAGEPLVLHRRARKSRPRNLVVLTDISGSMESYSNLLLHFVFGLSESLSQHVEAFVFGTQLTRITRDLRGHDVDRALAAVSRHVPDWSGGTRIGQSLKAFNFHWARRVLPRGAVVLVVSDGWDRGEAKLLRVEMARLQRSSFRLIWLNPLLESPGYEPLTRGMKAALPFVDDFLPMNNLSSLEDLAHRLQSLEEHRPQRKQQSVLLRA